MKTSCGNIRIVVPYEIDGCLRCCVFACSVVCIVYTFVFLALSGISINFWSCMRYSMNMSIAVALGAVLFIAVFLAKIYFVPGIITSGMFMTLVFVLAVIVVLILASG